MNYATWKEEVSKELLRRATSGNRKKALVTYGDLASRNNMPRFTANWKLHPLCDILGELDEADATVERPFISALVVNEKGYSGPGLYKTIAALRRNGNPIPEQDWKEYWSREVDRIFEYYN